MIQRSRTYQMASALIAISLLVQLFIPAMVFSQVTAVHANQPETINQEPTTAETAVTTPIAPATPLTISRVQSSYTAPGTVAITYSVHNTLPPVILPPVPASATITDTIAALDGFDPLNDPNTVRGVLLTSDLTGVGTLAGLQPLASQQGSTLAWNLGDIPPLQSVTAVVTLTLATDPANVTLLDSGATAYGHIAGQLATAAAAPALVNPASFSQWLIWTLDADLYDTEMLAQAGQLGHDPDRLFAYAQSLGYELYDGSLRGTRGSLWSEAGNSTDQASLLIAMLRASGVPARYRHGTLSQAEAQTLIASMFPEPTQYVGQLDPSLETADPGNDPALIAQAQDHWWVEAYLPGLGWTDLDPSFETAQIGDSFATPLNDSTDRIAELPDSIRHKVTVRLKVEDYYPLNLGQSGLDYTYPLSHTFRTVELAAEPVAFSHIVNTETQGGIVFANTIHTYTPYLLVGDQEIFGDPYQDILTNFPLGTLFHTAAWLQFDLTTPDGETTTHEREIVDKIGYEARVNGGNSNFTLTSDDSLFVTDFDIYATGFWPNIVPETAVSQVKAAALAQAEQLNIDGQRLRDLVQNQQNLTPSEQQEFAILRARFQKNTAQLLGNISLSFAETADRMVAEISEGLFIKAYYDTPRLIITGVKPAGSQAAFSMDLRRTAVRTLPYPGQTTTAGIGFNITKGFIESGIEGRVLEGSIGQPVLTTARIGTAAAEQGIDSVYLASDNLHLLDQLDLSPQAEARITSAAAAGKLVIIPAEKVQIDGGLHTGWWEINPTTGETIGVLEDGLHGALEYLFTIAFQIVNGPLADFMLGFTAYTWGFVADRFDKAVGDGSFDLNAYNTAIGIYAGMLTCVGAIATGGGLATTFCVSGAAGTATGAALDPFAWGQKAAEAYLTSKVKYDPPLASNWMAPDALTPTAQNVVTTTLPIAASLPTGNLNAALTTDFAVVSGTHTASYTTPDSAYQYESLTVTDGTLQDGNGSVIGSGAITAVPGSLSTTASTVTLSGSGQTGFYAAALPNIGSGSHFADVQANLDGSNLELTLPETAVTLNDVTYTGDFTIQAQSTAVLSGSGPVAAANHASSTTLNGSGLSVLLGAATGSATLGGQPLNVSDGVALTSYNGAVGISDSGSATQQVALNGAVNLFTLTATPATSTTTPETAVSFTATTASNFNDNFSLTLTAPAGWLAELNGDQATLTPAPGTAVGEYDITVTACPQSAPQICQTAVHTITIEPFDGFTLTVQPDPLTTIPMGAILADNLRPGSTNSGQAQVPGAAYTIVLTNTANTAHTYTFNVSGLPAGWTLLANKTQGETSSSLTLPPGKIGYLGLYVNPSGGQLPAPGTSFGIQITAVSDTSAQQSVNTTFTMPAVPFNYVMVEPPVLYLTSTASADIDLSITNVGNAAGDFPITTHDAFDAIAVTSTLNDVSNLAPGATAAQAVTLASSNAPIGSAYPVFFDSPAPGGVYTQTATLIVQITSQRAGQIMQAGRCSADNDGYPATVQSLGLAVQELETWCDLGDCPAQLRDNVAAAAQETANYGQQIPFTTAAPDLTSAASNLVSQSDDADILLAVDGVATAVTTLGNEVCEVEEHRPTLRWNPYTTAVLSGENANYSLELTNNGTLETTYAVTLTLPTGDTTQNVTIPAGQTTSLPVAVNNAPDGYHLLTATAVPTSPDVNLLINPSTQARLNVVDKFVQVTAVTADPPFVDTGVSATTLSVDVANVANVPLAVTAETAVIAPNGTTQATLNPPLNLLAGNPRTYELGPLDTSGWDEGTYTITVNLLDGNNDLLPDGFGYGYLSVGQTLSAQMSSSPLVAAPGTLTVTTILTTEIGASTFFTAPQSFANAVPGEVITFTEPVSDTDVLPAFMFGPPPAEEVEAEAELALDAAAPPAPAASFSIPGYLHYEENDAALLYNGDTLTNTLGAWTTASQTYASDGQTAYSGTLSDTVSLTFTGTAVFLGFNTRNLGGLAQVSIDGVDQEIVDTYSLEPDSLTRRYADLGAGSHTITITVLDQRNPFALRDNIYLDFIGVWEGSPLADGIFEAETAVRVFSSGDWNVLSDVGASGGQYLERGSTVWFPFTGDSVSLVIPSDRFSDDMRLFVDDQFIDYFDIFSPTFITNTISLDGFGAGAHLLRLETYRGRALIDAFVTPGTAPFWQPPDKSGFFRYEEDDPDLRYNGVPFFQTAGTWDRSSGNRSSDGQQVRTTTAGDSVALTFTGEWVSLGFIGEAYSTEIEILLDGVSQGVFDLYRHNSDPVTFQFGNLGAGVHTVTAVNLGTTHPNSSGTRMYLDYIDTWDGTPLPQGVIEAEDNSRTYYSSDIGVANEPDASGGAYVRDGILRQGNIWFPFTGDSITLQAWSGGFDKMRIKIDGIEQPPLDLFNTTAQTRTVNFEGLGAGVHVLELNRYRSDVNADAFIVPAIPATFPYPPVPQTGIVRHEEDSPAIRYNGDVYSQTVASWDYDFSYNISSDYVANTGNAGNNLTLDFDGSWFGVGFQSTVNTGMAEIYVDGQLLDTVDTSGNLGPMSRYYDVITGTHTISVTAVNPIRVDFIDVWDGTPMPDGWHDADLNDRIERFHYTNYWTTYSDDFAREEDMIGRGLVNTRRTMWFSFIGSDLTFRSYNDNNGQYEIFMDGVSQGVYTTTAVYSNQPINWHFPNLGDGPHVFSLLALDGASRTFVDAFHVNPEKFVDAAPTIEWFDFTAGPGGGFLTTMAAGDINNDGVVEIIAPSRDGNLYVYRGDGQDAGSGTPLLWSAATDVANEPSIADIDLDGYGEILLLSGDGLYAFEHDGATKWMTNTLFSSAGGGNPYGWGGVAVGNLDLDDAPELVVAPRLQQAAVVSADGTDVTRFGPTLGDFPTIPILVDANSDGFLDIVIADDNTLYVYDAFNGLNLLWSYTYDTSDISPNIGSQSWGAPAVANLDADDDPEIIMFFEEKVVALNHDGTELWVYKVERSNGFRPSHVTVADVDGDGEVEIIVAQALSAGLVLLNHEILVINADGTLLWSEIVKETTSSSSGVATHDFNGDGVWEVLWNGYGDGFIIFNGPDGDRIFNEPRINSGTIVDYPSVADVDGDHFAEVLLGDGEGLWVVGHDNVWADSRPLWSSTGYRITDLNDDLSVPVNEPPSWLLHNTYRTQTPERSPSPAYSVDVAYTAGVDQVTVLTPTISLTPTAVTPPTYTFSYRQEWYQPVITLSLVSEVGALQPGEVRQIAEGAVVSYTLPTGTNSLNLPPLFVTGAVIAELAPTTQTAVPGQTISYTLPLLNPGITADTYTLNLSGLPSDWDVSLPVDVVVPGGGQTAVTLALTVPADANLRDYPFILAVTTGSGGAVQLGGAATVQTGLALEIAATAGSLAPIGEPISHTLTITNLESAARTYALSTTGAPLVVLPPTVAVPASSSVNVNVTAAPTDSGSQAFSVQAVAAESGAVGSDTAVIQGAGSEGVAVALTPSVVETGPGGTAVFTVMVQNLGSSAHTFDLSRSLPPDWNGRFEANGQPVDEVFVATGVYNTAQLTLLVTPAETAVSDSFPISVTATAQTNTAVTGSADGQVDLNGLGVQVEILDQNVTINPDQTFSWDVRLTNTGEGSDTFTLTAAGLPVGADGAFSSSSVSLGAGASTIVQYTAGPFTGALPQAYSLSIVAQSGNNTAVIGQDQTTFTLAGQEGIVVAWQSASQTITNTFTAEFTLALTNTGNTATTYALNLSGSGLSFAVALDEILLPPGMVAKIPVAVQANGAGEFVLTGTAVGASTQASDTASLTVVTSSEPEGLTVYLPIIVRNP